MESPTSVGAVADVRIWVWIRDDPDSSFDRLPIAAYDGAPDRAIMAAQFALSHLTARTEQDECEQGDRTSSSCAAGNPSSFVTLHGSASVNMRSESVLVVRAVDRACYNARVRRIAKRQLNRAANALADLLTAV